MSDHMNEQSAIGSKEWWLEQVEAQNRSHVTRILEEIKEDSLPERDYLYFKRTGSSTYIMQGTKYSEKYLKDCFFGIGLFNRPYLLEEKVKLGNYVKKIDLVVDGVRESRWVIEFKIVEADVHDRKEPITIQRIGAAIGQALLYTKLYKKRFKENERFNLMPAVCTWLLGSGSHEVVEICRKVGVTLICLDSPDYMPNGQALRIYYLEDYNPRHFVIDNA